MKIVEHSSVPQERRHARSQIWWVAERGSPATYLGNEGSLTGDIWHAKKFPSLESAEEFVHSWANCHGTDWQILDHMFYIRGI